MTDFHRVTPTFSVAGQLAVADIQRAAYAGFKVIVKNRPEGEDPDQPSEAALRAAAGAAGLAYHALPFVGPPPPAVVAEMATLMDEDARGPILAYCRSGRRSIMAWALAEALSGRTPPDEILAQAAAAGYDLSGAREALESLAPRS
ncbi:MAG: TIGR01244 family sulfur transferase [Terricaulis sp.]